MKTLKQELDYWYKKVCVPEFAMSDPLLFPRCYKKRQDIEIAAFLTATIAWGRRDLILRSAEKMFALMGKSPYDYVMSGNYKNLKNKNIHRTFFESDLKYFCKGFKHCYTKYGNFEKLFSSPSSVPANQRFDSSRREAMPPCPNRWFECVNLWEGINLFRTEMAHANKNIFSKHISNPGEEARNGAACKRLNLALRWLVREGPVDLGLWKKIKPSELYIPLDVHVARVARELGLLQRKSNDKKAVIELTEKLRDFCPEDPVKYDFALFGMGLYLSPTAAFNS